MTRITAGGTAYEMQGRGPAVVLVHGMGLNRAMWQWLVPALTPRFQVVTYDLLGHDESADPAGRPELRSFSAQMIELLDCCGLVRAAVAGFSLGGMIARRFAIDHPDRLSALAVLHSAHGRGAEQRAAIGRRLDTVRQAGPAATVDAALARWFTDDFRARQPEIMDLVRRWMTANRKEVYRGDLPRLGRGRCGDCRPHYGDSLPDPGDDRRPGRRQFAGHGTAHGVGDPRRAGRDPARPAPHGAGRRSRGLQRPAGLVSNRGVGGAIRLIPRVPIGEIWYSIRIRRHAAARAPGGFRGSRCRWPR